MSNVAPAPLPIKTHWYWFGGALLSLGALLAVVGSGLSRNLSYDGGLSAVQMALSVALIIAAIFALTECVSRYNDAHRRFVESKKMSEGQDGQPGMPAQMMGPGMPQQAYGNPAVQRVCVIAHGFNEALVPDWSKFEFDGNDLIAYGFRSMKPGFFAKESVKNAFDEQLSSSMGSGWALNFDSETDTVAGTKKSSLPKLALPEMWPVVKSKAEAAANIPSFTLYIGVGENGPIGIKPKEVPHRGVYGSTGGGKSVAVRADLMQLLAAGFRIFAMDGKGTDFSPFNKFANVSAISTTLHAHVVLIHKVWMILQQRRAKGEEMSNAGDNSWRETNYPIAILLDEFASVRSNMKSEFSPKEVGLIERDIQDILKVGREFRVYAVVSTQDMKAETIKTDWQDQIIVSQSLGEPSKMTVNKAFPEEIQGEVRRLGGKISRKTPGRALVSITGDDGIVRAQLYQSYWSYSPAETLESAPAAVKDNWRQFKEQVADQIPRLYPREWVEPVYPEPAEGKKDPYADYREDSWVDLSRLTVDDLHKLRPVALEDPQTLEYIEGNAMFDPVSSSYVGRPPLGAGAGAGVIDV